MKTFKNKLSALTASMLLIAPFLSSAHPGHGMHDGNYFLHYFTSPLHSIVLLTVIVLISVLAYRRINAPKKI